MLSFPSQSWQSSMISNLKPTSKNPILESDPNPEYGRAASLIMPRLYLTDYFTAKNEEKMKELGITHMVTVMEVIPPSKNLSIIRHHVKIADRWNEDVLKHLDGTTEFIRAALQENQTNKVLVRSFARRYLWYAFTANIDRLCQVHCFQGISRSATVVCAYVISTAANGMTAQEAIDFVRSKRGIVNPNGGFRTALMIYSERFVGGRGKRATGGSTSGSAVANRKAKISEGIADRIRRFKGGGGPQREQVLTGLDSESVHQ